MNIKDITRIYIELLAISQRMSETLRTIYKIIEEERSESDETKICTKLQD